MVAVSICVATYKRPDGLRRLLDGLNNLTFDKFEEPRIEVIIVDNDPSESANLICEKTQLNFRWSLKYDVEKTVGVTHARNRTIANVSENADFIAILDDDEVPDAFWLEQLLLVQKNYQADIVTGPVETRFEDEIVPDWVVKGGFFDRAFRSTGQELTTAFTNNVLIRRQILEDIEPIFDERFAIKGAEDTYLFMKLFKAGYHIIWADDAIVYEWVPESRMSLEWLLNRGYWGWSSYSLFEKELYPSIKVQTLRFLKGGALIAAGMLSMLPAVFQGKYQIVKALLNIYRGAGSISGLIGLQGYWLANK